MKLYEIWEPSATGRLEFKGVTEVKRVFKPNCDYKRRKEGRDFGEIIMEAIKRKKDTTLGTVSQTTQRQ